MTILDLDKDHAYLQASFRRCFAEPLQITAVLPDLNCGRGTVPLPDAPQLSHQSLASRDSSVDTILQPVFVAGGCF